MRQIARVDANQAEIVAAARKMGAGILHLHQVGSGCPDLMIGLRRLNLLIEVKAVRGELTHAEGLFHLTWPGQVAVVRSIEELAELIAKEAR